MSMPRAAALRKENREFSGVASRPPRWAMVRTARHGSAPPPPSAAGPAAGAAVGENRAQSKVGFRRRRRERQ